jgi:hypothetical protein
MDGEQLKQKGMQRVYGNASLAWKLEADKAALLAARELELLTSDDVYDRISSQVFVHDGRAMGHVMTNAAKREWIVKSNLPGRPSRRPSLHKSPRTVWRSLVYFNI